MAEQHRFIRFDVRRDDGGLFIAVSPDLDGVFMAHRQLHAIINDMPSLVKLWFKSNRGEDVEVFQGEIVDDRDDFSFQAITVPVEIAAQALQR